MSLIIPEKQVYIQDIVVKLSSVALQIASEYLSISSDLKNLR